MIDEIKRYTSKFPGDETTLTEGKAISDSDIEKIANLISGNDHSGALLAGATLVNSKKLIKIFQSIFDLHHVIGHLPNSLGQLRTEYYQKLMTVARNRFSPEDYEKFKGVY